MPKYLYTSQDNVDLDRELEITNKLKNTIVPDNGAVILNLDSNKMFNNIKDIFTNEKKPEEINNYFTVGKGKFKFSIDNTIFTPSTLTLLGGKKFEERYVKQLEQFIFTDKEELNPDTLIHLIFMMDFIKKDNFPITITTGKHRHFINKIVNSMNNFFKKNYSVLSSIHVMFSGMNQMHVNNQEQENQDDRRG